MNIVLAGGTGFIGQALVPALLKKGHKVTLLVRKLFQGMPGAEQALWDGKSSGPWAAQVAQAQAVVNLAGESIAAGRWTAARKARLRNSRLDSVRILVSAMRVADQKPSVFINASAVGFYGDVPEGDVPESHPQGGGFLAELCAAWEKEALRAKELGARVVLPRIGIVLGEGGGALAKMLPPFKIFAGGPLGTGKQWFPWVHRDDIVGGILFALENDTLSGPVNFTAPDPVNMKDFCKALGKSLGRPSWAPVPGFVLKIMLGEMADMLLGGQKVVPQKLKSAGYAFTHPKLDEALASIIK